jgi:TPR repeat protein
MTYLEAAVAQDVPEAHTQLGLMHWHGWNMPVNLNEAIR